MPGDDENIRIRAELEGALTRDAHVAADAIDEIGDEAVQTAAQLEIMEAAMRGSARQSRDLGDEQRKVSKETSMFGRDAERTASKVDKLGESMARLDDRLSKVQKKKFDIRKLLNLYKLPAIITAVGILATGIAGLGAAAIGATAGIAPLAGLLTALPAGLLLGAQAFAAAKLATMGLGDAVKALIEGDPEKIAEAFEKMSPAMRQVAKDAVALGQGPIKRLRNDLGEALGPGLSSFLAESRPVWGTLRNELTGTAAVMGDLASRAGEVIGSPAFNGQLTSIMDSNNNALQVGGEAAGFFALALLNLVDAFGPTLNQMAVSTRGVAKYLEETTAAGLASGELADWFRDTWATAKDFGDVIADVAVALYNTGKAAGVMGDYLGGSIADASAKWRSWTESVEGQQAMRDYFADAIPVVESILKLLGGLGKAFASLSSSEAFVPTIDAITNDLLPVLAQTTDVVGTHFGPAIIEAVVAVTKLLGVLAYSPLADVLMVVARGVGMAADALNALPGPVKYVVAGILALSVAMRIMNGVALLTRAAFSPLTGVVTGWTGQAAERASAASREMTRFEKAGQRAKTVMLTGSAGSGFLGALGGPWGIAITAAITALGVFASSQAEAKAQVEALSASLNQQTGALGDGSYAAILESLGTEWVEYAEAAGVSQQEVLDAVVKGGGAIDDLSKKVNKARGFWGGMADSFTSLDFYALQGGPAEQFNERLNDTSAKLREATAETQRKAAADRAGASAVGQLAGATSHASTMNRLNANTMVGAGVPAAQAQKAAVDNLNATIGREAAATQRAAAAHRAAAAGARSQTTATYALNTAAVSTIGGQISFRQAVADTAKNLKRGAGNMSLFTQAGRDNQGAMLRVAEAANQVVGAAKKQAALKEARDKIAGWAQEAGKGKAAAERYADRIIKLTTEQKKIPGKKETKYDAPGLPGVLDQTRQLASAQDNIDRNIDINVTTRRQTIDGPRRHGGLVGPSRNLVGEVGPELYVPFNGGTPQIIGAKGPEFRNFADPGYVVPNDALMRASAATDAQLPSSVLAALDTAGSAGPVDRLEAAPAPVVVQQATPSLDDLPAVNVDLTIGDTAGMTPAQIEALVKRAVAAALREEREKRIAWSGSH